MPDYLRIYYLELYLFEDVKNKFMKNKCLDAFDFFCIIIWKANRAKSRVSKNLLNRDPNHRTDLNAIIMDISKSIFNADNHRERFRILIENWKFKLPLASAILTVLYPNDLTIYDKRVCEILHDFYNLKNKTNFDSIFEGYLNYKAAVNNIISENISLRDKDRLIWSRSFCNQLINDIENNFN